MSDPRLEDYMKAKRYLKIEKDTHIELDRALENLHSDDIALRKQGEKRLSWNSRRELGLNCYPVRVWFLDQCNKKDLFDCIRTETDIKIQRGLLGALKFFHERYMTHWFWDDIRTETELKLWMSELLSFIEGFIDNPSPDIRSETAYILAMLEDSRAWGLYNGVLQKRAGEIHWFTRACARYAEKSLDCTQIKHLTEILETILARTKNNSVKREARWAVKFCEERFGKSD